MDGDVTRKLTFMVFGRYGGMSGSGRLQKDLKSIETTATKAFKGWVVPTSAFKAFTKATSDLNKASDANAHAAERAAAAGHRQTLAQRELNAAMLSGKATLLELTTKQREVEMATDAAARANLRERDSLVALARARRASAGAPPVPWYRRYKPNSKHIAARAVGAGATGGMIIGGISLGALGESLKMATDWDTFTRRVGANANILGKHLDVLKRKSLDWSTQSGADAKDVVTSWKDVATMSAGKMGPSAIMHIIKAATKSALPTGSSVSDVTSMLMTELNAAGLHGKRAMKMAMPLMNMAHTASALSHMNMSDFVNTYSPVAAIAASTGPLKTWLPQSQAAVAALTQAGYSPQRANTQVQDLYAHILKMSGPQQKFIAQLYNDSHGKINLAKDFSLPFLSKHGILGVVNDVAKLGLNQRQRMTLIPALRGGIGFNALVTKARANFNTDTTTITNSPKAHWTEGAWKQYLQSPAAQMKIAEANIKALTIIVGTQFIPVFVQALKAIVPWVKMLTQWVKGHKELTKNLLLGGVALGALSLIVKGLMGPFSFIIKLFAFGGKALFVLGKGAFQAGQWLFGLGRAAGALAIDFVQVAAKAVWSATTTAATWALNTAKTLGSLAMQGAGWLVLNAQMLAYSIGTKVAAAGQWLLNLAMDANPIGIMVLALTALVAGVIYAYKNIGWFRNIVNATGTAIKNVASGALSFLKKAFGDVIGVLSGLISWAKTNWKTLLVAALLAPIAPVVLAFGIFGDQIKAFFGNLLTNVINQVKTWGQNFLTWIKNAAIGVVTWVKTNWPFLITQALLGPFNLVLAHFFGTTWPRKMLTFGGKMIARFIAGIQGAWHTVTKTATDTGNKITRAIGDAFKKHNPFEFLYNTAKDFIGKILGIPGLKEIVGWLTGGGGGFLGGGFGGSNPMGYGPAGLGSGFLGAASQGFNNSGEEDGNYKMFQGNKVSFKGKLLDWDYGAAGGSQVRLPQGGPYRYLGKYTLAGMGTAEFFQTPNGGVFAVNHLENGGGLTGVARGAKLAGGTLVGKSGEPTSHLYNGNQPDGTPDWHLCVVTDDGARAWFSSKQMQKLASTKAALSPASLRGIGLPSDSGAVLGLTPMILKAAKIAGVDPRVLASQVYQESRGNPTAKSWNPKEKVWDIGLMQYGPSEAKLAGGKYTMDPFGNLVTGAKYLAYLTRKYGSTMAALLHYNGSPQYVTDVLRRVGAFGNAMQQSHKGGGGFNTPNTYSRIAGGGGDGFVPMAYDSQGKWVPQSVADSENAKPLPTHDRKGNALMWWTNPTTGVKYYGTADQVNGWKKKYLTNKKLRPKDSYGHVTEDTSGNRLYRVQLPNGDYGYRTHGQIATMEKGNVLHYAVQNTQYWSMRHSTASAQLQADFGGINIADLGKNAIKLLKKEQYSRDYTQFQQRMAQLTQWWAGVKHDSAHWGMYNAEKTAIKRSFGSQWKADYTKDDQAPYAHAAKLATASAQQYGLQIQGLKWKWSLAGSPVKMSASEQKDWYKDQKQLHHLEALEQKARAKAFYETHRWMKDSKTWFTNQVKTINSSEAQANTNAWRKIHGGGGNAGAVGRVVPVRIDGHCAAEAAANVHRKKSADKTHEAAAHLKQMLELMQHQNTHLEALVKALTQGHHPAHQHAGAAAHGEHFGLRALPTTSH